MKILVTGATGFVGRALCQRILATTDYQIRKLVRNPPASPASHASVGDLPEDIRVIADIATVKDWPSNLQDIDCVVHLAARAHQMQDRGFENFHLYHHINVAGTMALAEAAAKQGVRKFIFLSSVKAAGEQNTLDRNLEPIFWDEYIEPRPSDAYGQTKLHAEQALMDLANRSPMQVIILRPPLVFGPGVKANFLNLIKLVEKGLPVPLASIANKRSFIFVENLADAIITCIKNTSLTGSGIYFIADDPPHSTEELAQEIARSLGRKPRFLKFPYKLMTFVGTVTGKSNLVRRLTGSLALDVSRFRKNFGWTSPVGFPQAINATIQWYLERNSQVKP